MDALTTKTKELTSESSQPQDSKKFSHKSTPKVRSSKTSKVHKDIKMTTAAHAQTDKKQKLKQKAKSKKDAAKANAAKKEADAAATKFKPKGSSSASAPASASVSDPTKKKKKTSTKGAASAKESEGSKAHKRTASEVEGSNEEDEDEAEGWLRYHRPTKTYVFSSSVHVFQYVDFWKELINEADRIINPLLLHITYVLSRRIQKGKGDGINTRPASKRKESVHNPAIWKMISGGSIASSDSSTTTTMITTDKDVKTMDETAIKATIIDSVTSATITSVVEVAPATDAPPSDVGLRVVEEVQDAVDQMLM
ncbi:hypothetical protein BG015_007375 [Linnemannia schmuckeri]|uniref:Uncharacterized protein n=1 Tax=Linnemannia schmuckeri TaxID=64567 RepID=A0A9P5S8H4_9FUNG|nr:hypothetical protein BG015_007375 [Linnemannia schmuckeri]